MLNETTKIATLFGCAKIIALSKIYKHGVTMKSKNHGFTWAGIAAMAIAILVPVSIHYHNCVRSAAQAQKLERSILNAINPPRTIVFDANDWT